MNDACPPFQITLNSWSNFKPARRFCLELSVAIAKARCGPGTQVGPILHLQELPCNDCTAADLY